MAFTFQVPRQKPVTPQYTAPTGKSRFDLERQAPPQQSGINPQTKTLNTQRSLFDIQRQDPVSEGQRIAEDQNTQGLKTGQWGDVESARAATERTNALRTSNALQATRGAFARSGVDTSPEAATRAQDQAFSAAEAENLNGTNAVNQLQRQYRSDAMVTAGKNEQGYTDRQNATTNTIGTLGNLDIANKNANINQQNADTTRISAEGDNVYKTGSLGLEKTKIDNAYDIDRGKLALDTTKVGQDYHLGSRAADTNEQNANTNSRDVDNRHTLGNRNAANDERKTENDMTLGEGNLAVSKQNADTNQKDVENRAKEAAGRLGLDYEKLNQEDKHFLIDQARNEKQFGVTSKQTDRSLDQKDTEIQNQAQQSADKLGLDWASLNQNDKQFLMDLERKKSVDSTTKDQDQQKIDNQKTQYNQSYSADRADAADSRSRFDITRGDKNAQFDITAGQSQQQIDNQAAQAAQRLGYDYANLSQNDQQFFQKMAQDQSQFDVSSGQTQQEINNRKSQFDITRGDTQKSNTMNEINAIQDPVARNLALKAYYSGGDVSSAIGGNIGADGQLINKSMSPGAAAYQAKVDELQATYPNKSQAEIQQMVQERAAKADTLTQGVTDTQTKAVSQQTSMERLSRLKAGETPALEDLANIPSVNPAAIPLGKNTAEFLKNNTTGGWTNIGGQPYKVIKGERWKTKESDKYMGMGESARHEDFAELQDPSGKTLYLNAKGQIVDKKPGTK